MGDKLEKAKKEFIKEKFPPTHSDRLWNELKEERKKSKEFKKVLKDFRARIDILLEEELECYPRYKLLMLRDVLVGVSE